MLHSHPSTVGCLQPPHRPFWSAFSRSSWKLISTFHIRRYPRTQHSIPNTFWKKKRSRHVRLGCARWSGSATSSQPKETFSEDMKSWLTSSSHEGDAGQDRGNVGVIPVMRVADCQSSPDSDEEDEFVLDEIILDEEMIVLDEEVNKVEDDERTMESKMITKPQMEPQPAGAEQSVAPQSVQLKPWSFQLGGVLLGVGLVCFIQWIWSIVKASERIPVSEVPEEDADLTDLQQSLKSLQSLPFGAQRAQDCEPVEWVNMCWRKAWRVYQRGLERWFSGLLQNLFDSLVEKGKVPTFVQRLRVLELTFDHEAPCLSNMRRRPSRKDSDLNGVVDVRYTGDARMLLILEVGGGEWRLQVPVLVSDLDIECRLWVKIRLAPLSPYLGTVSLAFVGPPNIKVQLSPYNSVRLMRVPVLQNFLNKFLTEDLPSLMVLPKRLEINIPPAVTAVAEAAVGRDAVMKAVASAVLQADVVEQSLVSALPLGPQGAAGGISVPDSFQGELSVTLIGGRNLPVWGFPWQSNPYCRLTLGKQAVTSKRESDTSCEGTHQNPIWNQEFEFLVEDTERQVLEIFIKDSHLTGRPEVGKVEFSLKRGVSDKTLDVWLPVQSVNPGQTPSGELRLELTYKRFLDDDEDSGFREAEAYARENRDITDVKSAAAASSKAAVAASAAFAAVAMTKAAAARAAHKAQQAANAAKSIASLGSMDTDDLDEFDETDSFDSDSSSEDLDHLDDEEVLKYENKNGTIRSSSAALDGYLEDDSQKRFKPASDLEGPELAEVLDKVEANLGENIASVVGVDELASQLSILRTEESSDKYNDSASESNAQEKFTLNQQTIKDRLSVSRKDKQDITNETLWSQSNEERYWDGSNFDMPGVVPLLDHHEDIGRPESTDVHSDNPQFIFRAGETVTEVEPPEAVPTPFLQDNDKEHVGSYTTKARVGSEIEFPSSALFKDVAASVTALEGKLNQAGQNQGLPYHHIDNLPENATSDTHATDLGVGTSESLSEPGKLPIEDVSKKRRRDGYDENGSRNQWIMNLWQRARRKNEEKIRPTTETPSVNLSPDDTEVSGSAEDSSKKKSPWWAILAAAVSLRRVQSESDDGASDRVRSKPSKKRKKRRSGSSPRLDIPPIDMAAIARELANMRKEKASEKDKQLEDLQSMDLENFDREWIIFLCFLTACSAALLTVVAYRLQHF